MVEDKTEGVNGRTARYSSQLSLADDHQHDAGFAPAATIPIPGQPVDGQTTAGAVPTLAGVRHRGGTYLHAIVAAAILGILPIVLDVVGFGVILGRGTQAGVLAGVFGFGMIAFGSLIGGGFAMSRASGAPPH